MTIILTWDDIDEMVVETVKWITEERRIDTIFGITMGGIIPATLIAKQLKIDNVMFIGKESIQQALRSYPIYTLVVDDISDTGETLSNVIGFGNVSVATLCVRQGTHVWPNYYGRIIKDKSWVKFPWEREDEIRNK